MDPNRGNVPNLDVDVNIKGIRLVWSHQSNPCSGFDVEIAQFISGFSTVLNNVKMMVPSNYVICQSYASDLKEKLRRAIELDISLWDSVDIVITQGLAGDQSLISSELRAKKLK